MRYPLRCLNWHAWEMQKTFDSARRQRVGLLVKDNEDFQKKCKLKIAKTPLEAKAKSKPTKLPRKPIITCFQVGSPEMGTAAKKVTAKAKAAKVARAKGKQVKGKIAKRRRNCSYWVDRACAKIDFAKFVEAQTLRTGFSWLPHRPTLKEVPI